VKEEWDITILMVEHDMAMVMDISDHVVVLNFGQLIAQGLPNEVQATPRWWPPTWAAETRHR
jgi:branched-chain amino acid transport system ATP-binding protein